MNFPKVITIACEKGGVGKTTVATNLAVYLKAMCEDLPVTLFSFDNHFTVDRMLSLKKSPYDCSVQDLFDGREMGEIVQLGQYGVGFIPSARRLEPGEAGVELLSQKLALSSLEGIVIMDTRPTIDYFTKSALLSSDLVIVPVKDLPSLNNIKGMTDFFEEAGAEPPEILLLPSIVDGMVKFKNNTITMDSFLRFLATERGHTLMKDSIPKSPKVEALNTNIAFEVYPVINHARNTQVHRGFTSVTREVLEKLDAIKTPRAWMNYRKEHFLPLTEEDRKYRQLSESVVPYCPLCAEEIATADSHIKPEMLYFESGGHMKGFMDRPCFDRHLLSRLGTRKGENDSFAERLKRSLHEEGLLGITPHGAAGKTALPTQIVISLHDGTGELIAKTLLEGEEIRRFTPLLPDITEATPVGPSPCMVRLGHAPFPDAIFLEKHYNAFQDAKMKALLDSGGLPGRAVTRKKAS